MMKIFLIPSMLLVIGIIRINGPPQNIFGQVQYLMRVVNVTAVDSKGEHVIIEEKWRRKELTQIYSATFKLPKTFVARRILIRFERCIDLELACENFQTWNLSSALFCNAIKMKNQMWSPLISAVKPPNFFQNCPRFNQGIGKIENGAIDINSIIKFYNEAPKYSWKVYTFYYNPNNEIEMQAYMHAFFVKYTIRHLKE